MSVNLTKVHEDFRGYIYLVENLLENKELTFLEIKKGCARGGCYHTVDENWIVIKGNVCVLTMDIDEKNEIDGKPGLHGQGAIAGTSGKFKARTAHAFIANEDSIVIEFGVSTTEKEENKKYEPLLKHVNYANDIMNKK